MKSIVLIHTVKSMYLDFERRLKQLLDFEVKVFNILDTYFAINSNELGYFSKQNVDRLLLTLKSAELTGASVIATICSTLSPHAKMMAPLLAVPVVTIDGQLGRAAIELGSNIIVLASAPSAIGPTSNLIQKAADEAGKQITIDNRYNIEALKALLVDDMVLHDKLIMELAQTAKEKDVIVFAQGSMEHLADFVSDATGLPVVTSPSLCLQEIKNLLEN